MSAMAQRYPSAGVRLVWLVWPRHLHIAAWRPGAHQPVPALNVGENHDGLDVLPDFTYPLARLVG
jgi:hypothetical protein